MSSQPDELRAQIDQTRRDLSRDVEALTGQVTPGNLARRQGRKVTGAVSGLKERIMGSDDEVQTYGERGAFGAAYGTPTHPAGHSENNGLRDGASHLADAAGQRVSDVTSAVAGAPTAATRRTRGNPLAAGLIAFGAGWLAGSLVPASTREQEASAALKEKAAPLVEEAQSVAQEAVSHLKEPARQAVEEVKASASDAASTVTEEARGAATDVKESAQDSAATVTGSSQAPSDSSSESVSGYPPADLSDGSSEYPPNPLASPAPEYPRETPRF